MPLPLKPSALTHRLFSYEAHGTIEGRTLKTRREFVSRVPGQVCAPDLEAEIMGPLKTVAENLTNTRLPFANIESRVAVAAPPDPERMSTLLAN
jgi:hypothetical protein